MISLSPGCCMMEEEALLASGWTQPHTDPGFLVFQGHTLSMDCSHPYRFWFWLILTTPSDFWLVLAIDG